MPIPKVKPRSQWEYEKALTALHSLLSEADDLIKAHDEGRLSPVPHDSCRVQSLRHCVKELRQHLPALEVLKSGVQDVQG